MADRQLPSYHKTLLRYVALFIFVPVIMLFSFIYMNLFQDNLENAQTTIKQHGYALTSDIRAKLSELRNQIYKVVANRGIAEVPVNIFYSQNAILTLQHFVDSNPLIEAAFIQDDAGFIIEGWPVEALRFRSDTMTAYTQQAMELTSREAEANLLWLPPQQYSGYHNTSSENSQSHILMYAMTLFAETDSIISPYESTGTLNVIINLDNLIQHDAHNEVTQQHNQYLIADDEPIFAHQPQAISESLTQTFITRLLASHSSGKTAIKLQLQYDETIWNNAFWSQTTRQITPLLLFLPLMVWFFFRFTRNFHKPIDQMVEICRNLVSGNYNIAQQSATFQEFDVLFRRLHNMAETISTQIKSLEQARSRAEQSEKIKSQFLANMSHEIRTPMNGVLGMLQLIDSDQLTVEQKERVNLAKVSAHSLLQIINDILDISKIEANQIKIERVQCNVTELVQRQTDSMQQTAAQRNNLLKALVKPPFEQTWLTDPTRLNQVLTNLLSNALKFTQNGKVMVLLSQENDNQLQITVKDTGIGIPAEKLSSLFQPFQQADASTTREYGGTGLGLTISKNLCKFMGGDLTVNSTPGKGSEFTATFAATPVRESDALQNQTSQEETRVSDSENRQNSVRKVAVVAEDNEINQEVIKAMLQEYNLDIHMANNGRDAVALVEHLKPDVVLMDVHMPIMDGVTATQTIRDRGFATPIIMQTANVMTEDVKHYLRIGADDVVAKPIVKDELHEVLSKWLNSSPNS